MLPGELILKELKKVYCNMNQSAKYPHAKHLTFGMVMVTALINKLHFRKKTSLFHCYAYKGLKLLQAKSCSY